ncbi:MAG: choice-of-anchor tandem repeat GloVer-containing protein [Capsulimonas sp.]|uniref:choice-of-anchor tandem repeat GloVer-containing protein n=1 Tax=Capsulimonas sp. TaxID=2494211 RepID=UPI003262F2A7
MSFFKHSLIQRTHFTVQSTLLGVSSSIATLALATLLTTTTVEPTYAHGVVTILHKFHDVSVANDGMNSVGKPIQKADGIYGVTRGGGSAGYGTAYKISNSGVYTILHNFQDGSTPNEIGVPCVGLTLGSDGNFYGITSTFADGVPLRVGPAGAIFRMTSDGVVTILHQFDAVFNGSATYDEDRPSGSLREVSPGVFYGLTSAHNEPSAVHQNAIVYSITSAGVYTVIHTFNDPFNPAGELLLASDGNLYGTATSTAFGDYGTVFQITPNGSVNTVHSFTRDSNAITTPQDALMEGADGYLYGAGIGGGIAFHGGIFKMTKTGVTTTVHSFGLDEGVSDDGLVRIGPMVQDSSGAIYGTFPGGTFGYGLLFEIDPSGVLGIKRNFNRFNPENAYPIDGVTLSANGVLIGATRGDSYYNYGTVYKIALFPDPTLTQISNPVVQAGHYPFSLTVTGTNFMTGATVYLNGTPLSTTLSSSTQLIAAVPAADVAASGTANITVGYPQEGQTSALPLTITPATTLVSLSPNTAQAGSNDFTFAVNGTNFIPSSQVVFNGAYITTHYVTPTQLTATVPRGYITAPAAMNVTVINPGVQPTAPLPFTVTGPAVPARCAPSTVQAGHASFNLSIVGTGFTSSTKAYWNGTLLTTYFISSGQIVATVPAAFVTAPTTATITVTPTTPATTPISFPVTAAPVFTGMTPSTTNAGHADFTLTAIGTGFVVGAEITWNGTPLTTTYVSPTNLTATIPAALVTSAGTATAKVINPGVAPTGPRTFTITP